MLLPTSERKKNFIKWRLQPRKEWHMESVENTYKQPLKRQTVQNEVFIQYLSYQMYWANDQKILEWWLWWTGLFVLQWQRYSLKKKSCVVINTERSPLKIPKSSFKIPSWKTNMNRSFCIENLSNSPPFKIQIETGGGGCWPPGFSLWILKTLVSGYNDSSFSI